MLQDAMDEEVALINWAINGGIETLKSFPKLEYIEDIPTKYWDFIEQCKNYHETNDHIFVHAGLKPNIDIGDQAEEDLLWIRFNELKPHKSQKILVCGHTPDRKKYKPRTKKGAICIDTYVYGEGYLTCLDMETGTYVQANEEGKTREGKIEF